MTALHYCLFWLVAIAAAVLSTLVVAIAAEMDW